MKVAVIGTGHVGLVTGVCLAELGAEAACVDSDRSKVALLRKGVCPIHEPGLPELLEKNAASGRISFSAEPGPAVAGSRVIFLCVNTPTRESDGKADLSQVFRAAEDIAPFLEEGAVVTVKSTVPIGAGRRVGEALRRLRPDADFEVASNPEFLSAGTAVADFLRPYRVVIGADAARARETLAGLYQPLASNGVPVVHCNPETAELIKVASNAFLAAKIAFINEMADLCEQAGADVRELARGVGLDERIGSAHLRAGPGYGGLCFPKDTVALVRTARDAGAPVRLVEAVVEANEQRKLRMADRVAAACGGSVEGATVAVLGLAFKPGTHDLRNSPGIEVVAELRSRGARVRAHDPVALAGARELRLDISCFETAEAAVQGADVLVFATAWEQYRELDLERLREAMRAPVVVDFHNLFEAEAMRQRGFDYRGIGLGRLRRAPSAADSGSPRPPLLRPEFRPSRDAAPGSPAVRKASRGR